MKKAILILCGLLVVIGSCKKKETAPKNNFEKYNGTVSALRNGKTWKPACRAIFDLKSNDRFHLDIVDYKDGFDWDAMSIGNVSAKEGSSLIEMNYWDWQKAPKYSVKGFLTAFYNGSFNEGSDVRGRNSIRTDRPHYISIDYYNPSTRELRGHFEVSFLRSDTSRSHELGLLDTISYTNATFSAIIRNVEELQQ